VAGSRQSLRLVPLESFGSLLRRRRRADNLTQAELAARLGVRQQTIGAWERGERPQKRFFNALANYLGVGEQEVVRRLDSEPLEARLAGEEETLGVALVGNQLRMISVQADGAIRFLDPHNQSHTLLYVASLEAYELKSLVDELEALINTAGVSESRLQSFFERNPRFLCGDIYEGAYPHIVLGRPDVGPLIPDFALKPSNESALCDLLELKLPSAKPRSTGQ
jgi:transcriptional regulator with XRE-family HTH domain